MEPEARFSQAVGMLDGNPFVTPPPEVMDGLFAQVGRSKGPIPVKGTVNDRPYQQTLVKFAGAWRLYINMQMLDDSPRRIGEVIEVTIDVDPSDRSIPVHPKLRAMLDATPEAKKVFDGLAPSRQKEIVRYIDNLKNEESIDRNVERARDFLLGKTRFVGRDSP